MVPEGKVPEETATAESGGLSWGPGERFQRLPEASGKQNSEMHTLGASATWRPNR